MLFTGYCIVVVVELEVLTDLEMLGPMAAGKLQGCSFKASNNFGKISNFSIKLFDLVIFNLQFFSMITHCFIQINLSFILSFSKLARALA